MTTLTRFDSLRATRALARATALVALVAVVSSVFLIAITGSIELAIFSVFAVVGGAYAAKVGWRSR
ncbi:MAG: hypothetical protein ACRDWA_16685 [Acidimicrobiia bacterium]